MEPITYRVVIARSEYLEFCIEAENIDEAAELIPWPEDGYEWELVDYAQNGVCAN